MVHDSQHAYCLACLLALWPGCCVSDLLRSIASTWHTNGRRGQDREEVTCLAKLIACKTLPSHHSTEVAGRRLLTGRSRSPGPRRRLWKAQGDAHVKIFTLRPALGESPMVTQHEQSLVPSI